MPEFEPDPIDRKILDLIQSGFPIERRPYAKIGQLCGIAEEEAFRRVERMRETGLIRRLGANFQSAGLGFVSTLCAERVPSAKLDVFIERVNAIPGVTHNYEREHEWNIWFTLIAESREESRKILHALQEETGVEIMDLPATRLFKIRVDFSMADQE